MSEPCIGYCDPTNEGTLPHPEWPADMMCKECAVGAYEEHLEEEIAIAMSVIGEEATMDILKGLI